MDNDRIKLWLYLTTKLDISRTKLFRLYKYFKSAAKICSASAQELRKSGILTDEEITGLVKKDFDGIDELIKVLDINSVRVLTIECMEYPEMLLGLSNPPCVLYCRGKFIDLNNYVCIASVGTRTPTSYGKKCTYEIVKNLCRAGFLIVSGMAQGIDAISHMAATDSGYPTVAFVATGVDVIYPKINVELHHKILENGMIVSEYPLGALPKKYSFLERNRLIAGVAKGMFLAEAGVKSGSAASASYALDMGKDIFALPGNITSPMSAEPNRLIKAGAYPVTEAEDIISCYSAMYGANLEYGKCLKTRSEGKIFDESMLTDDTPEHSDVTVPEDLDDEEKILYVLRLEPCGIDVISAYTGISINDLNLMLLMLEMGGKIKSDSGIYYPM